MAKVAAVAAANRIDELGLFCRELAGILREDDGEAPSLELVDKRDERRAMCMKLASKLREAAAAVDSLGEEERSR